MPELPELEVLKENLVSQIKGKKIEGLQILKPYILKNYFKPLENRTQWMEMGKNKSVLARPVRNGSRVGSNAPSDLLTGFTEGLNGEKIENIERRGKFLIIKLSKHKIIIHLMLHGSIKYVLPSVNIKKNAAALIRFDDGTVLEMSETGSKKRMSIYILPHNELLKQIENLGIEPLENDFTIEKLKSLLQKESKQIKSFLCDQKKIVGIGNAYADEILWQAGISPFKITTKLDKTEIKNLHRAIIAVLKWAIDQVRDRGISEKRDFLIVHNKGGKACPKCGDLILSVQFSNRETFYCPKCQTRGRKLKDRRLSKLFR